jgi:hypothetical protein
MIPHGVDADHLGNPSFLSQVTIFYVQLNQRFRVFGNKSNGNHHNPFFLGPSPLNG